MKNHADEIELRLRHAVGEQEYVNKLRTELARVEAERDALRAAVTKLEQEAEARQRTIEGVAVTWHTVNKEYATIDALRAERDAARRQNVALQDALKQILRLPPADKLGEEPCCYYCGVELDLVTNSPITRHLDTCRIGQAEALLSEQDAARAAAGLRR